MIAILLMTLAQFIAHTRTELAKGGLEKVQFGETVYWRGGTGHVLVLLHGANDQAGTWFAVAPKLSKRHRVLAAAPAGGAARGGGPAPLLGGGRAAARVARARKSGTRDARRQLHGRVD